MKIELHALECHHPLGPYIHIVTPETNELLNGLLAVFDLQEQINQELAWLGKLATEKVPADKCTVYRVLSNEADAWALVALRARADGTHGVRAIFIRVDPESPLPGLKVVDMFRAEFVKILAKQDRKSREHITT